LYFTTHKLYELWPIEVEKCPFTISVDYFGLFDIWYLTNLPWAPAFILKGQNFFANRLRKFIQPIYKSDTCPLNIWELHIFFINVIKKTCEKYLLLKQHVFFTWQWTNVNLICRLYKISYKSICRKFLFILKCDSLVLLLCIEIAFPHYLVMPFTHHKLIRY